MSRNSDKRAVSALLKLFRLRNMSIRIKTHLVKALILHAFDYPPITTHVVSKTHIKSLQKIQNKALSLALIT